MLWWLVAGDAQKLLHQGARSGGAEHIAVEVVDTNICNALNLITHS